MDLKSFTAAIQQIADEKGISRDAIMETIEMALAAAYKRDYGKRGQIIRASMDPDTGRAAMTQIKIAVDESMIKSEEEIAEEEAARVETLAGAQPPRAFDDRDEQPGEEKKVRFNPEKHIMMDEARAIKPDVQPGDELEFPVDYPEDAAYGRIAAQTAKQVILQRIRESEREAVFNDFKDKEGELVSGLVQRIEGRNVFIDIGRTQGVMPSEEQIPGERYRIGERIKALITIVEKNPRGPGVFLSRSHPRMLKKLFELEVPEISSGAVEIKSVAREAGARSKVAVMSHESGVDPVGSLVGQKGVRVSTVIQELGGEKIDVIEWSDDPPQMIAHSLSPAKVLAVEINEPRHEARAIVPDEQLSLAIGKRGQNVRLAAKLTGWKIDVRAPAAPEGEADNETPAGESGEEKPDTVENIAETESAVEK
ncbi:MAG: transcription termination factor NusA [Patescibacteria group bacterium]